MQLDAYHVRRGFVQKTANKVVYNDGKRLLFAYPFLDVAALMDLLYISRSSAVRPTLRSQVHHNVTTSFSQYLWSSSVSLALYVLSMILKIFPDIIYFQMHLCVSPCFCSGSTFHVHVAVENMHVHNALLKFVICCLP